MCFQQSSVNIQSRWDAVHCFLDLWSSLAFPFAAAMPNFKDGVTCLASAGSSSCLWGLTDATKKQNQQKLELDNTVPKYHTDCQLHFLSIRNLFHHNLDSCTWPIKFLLLPLDLQKHTTIHSPCSSPRFYRLKWKCSSLLTFSMFSNSFRADSVDSSN